MKKLEDFVTIIRSKNAGPLFLTFDLIFPDRETMEYVWQTGVITKAKIGALYKITADDVDIIRYEVVNAIKITIPRKYVSGDIRDEDIYGCQQHVPLAEMEVR